MGRSNDTGVHPDEAYHQSIRQLKENSCRHGFLAAPYDRRNYRSIWARDGCICATAAYLSGDDELIDTARRTLRTLSDHQAENGQIPSYLAVTPNDQLGEVNYGGFGEVTGIDSSLWFLFACHSVFRQTHEREYVDDPLHERYREVIRYLSCVDANSCGLLEIPIAGDWSDILNRSYHVLYDEVLWFRALFGAAELARDSGHGEDAARYARMAERAWQRLNEDFWWDSTDTIERVASKYMIRNALPRSPDFHYYQSHLCPFLNTWYHRFDAFANVLAALMGVASPKRTGAIIRAVIDRGLDRPCPLRVLDPPIQEGDEDAYQLRLSDEPPFQYHNGGIWPLAGGFWVVLLKQVGREDEARRALHGLACTLHRSRNGEQPWGQYEYMHGITCEPCGTRHMSWTSAAYVLAYQAQVHGRYAYFAWSAQEPMEEIRSITSD